MQARSFLEGIHMYSGTKIKELQQMPLKKRVKKVKEYLLHNEKFAMKGYEHLHDKFDDERMKDLLPAINELDKKKNKKEKN